MNERVKELKSQCWDERPYGPPWFNSDKFAELIVWECAKISLECGINLNREDFRQGIARNIKQHFGVEE